MMAMCMLCCLRKCSSSCFFVFMPSMLSCRMLMLCVLYVLGVLCGWVVGGGGLGLGLGEEEEGAVRQVRGGGSAEEG